MREAAHRLERQVERIGRSPGAVQALDLAR
jgi:hypothetical protein